MVGVPGKFKGCNTCRSRRVKCDNQRPTCKKCVDTGRECGGYDRERVFIVGTAEDRGRCSSHPHRSLSTPRSKKSKTVQPKSRGFSIAQIECEVDKQFVRMLRAPSDRIQCLTLHAKIESLEPIIQPVGEFFTLPSLANCVPEFGSSSGEEFSLHTLCLVDAGAYLRDKHLKETPAVTTRSHHNTSATDIRHSTSGSDWMTNSSLCLFLYDVGPSLPRTLSFVKPEPGLDLGFPLSDSTYVWRQILGGTATQVREESPSSYKSFPAHFFFARLFRNNACFDAISRRKSTFLAEPEWCTVPWEDIPKSDLDLLIDALILLPGIFESCDQLTKQPPTISRRIKAKDLLKHCTHVSQMFEKWYGALCAKSDTALFWELLGTTDHDLGMTDDVRAVNQLPSLFSGYMEFLDTRNALLHMHYWSGLCLFYRAVQQIHKVCVAAIPQHARASPRSFTSTPQSFTPDSTFPSFPPPPQAPQILTPEASFPSFMTITTTVNTPSYAPELVFDSYVPPISFQVQSQSNYETQQQQPSFEAPSSLPRSFVPEALTFDSFGEPATTSQSFTPGPAFNTFSPSTNQTLQPQTRNFFDFDPSFLVPATLVQLSHHSQSMQTATTAYHDQYYSNFLLPSTPLTTTTSNPYPVKSTPHTPHTRSRSHSTNYITSRSPTPTPMSASSASSSQSHPSSQNSLYVSTPPPPLPSLPPLDPKYTNANILTLVDNVLKGLEYVVRATTIDGLQSSDWGLDLVAQPLQVVSGILRELGDVNNNSVTMDRGEWCAIAANALRRDGWEFARKLGQRTWREWRLDVDS